jgi:phosphate-selective porin OprO/OprP
MKAFLTPLALMLLAGPAFAQSPTDTDKRIANLEKQVAKLTATKEAAKDGDFYVKFGGRFHLDNTYFSGNDNRLTNGTFMRRARISFKLGLGKDWVGEGDVDFALNEVAIKDLWVGYQGYKNTLIQLGQFKESFGMDTLTSSNNTWLMERSYSDIWTPDRHVGIGVAKWGERWQAKASFFGQAIDDTSEAQEVADTNVDSTGLLKTYKIYADHGYGVAARLTYLPFMVSDTKLIHLGVAAVQRTPNAGAPETYAVDFSGRPEQNKVAKEKFLSAAVTNVDKWTQTGLEFAGVWGPFSWQSEYQQTSVKRRGTQLLTWSGTALVATSAAEQLASTVDHKFSTYYAQVSWVFGGQRNYEVSEGIFKGVKASKNGAWEIVARYSKMDQNDLTAIDPVAGGVATNITLGLTYYLNKNVRFMLNQTKVDNGLNAVASKAYSPTGVKLVNDDFNTTTMRVQVNF